MVLMRNGAKIQRDANDIYGQGGMWMDAVVMENYFTIISVKRVAKPGCATPADPRTVLASSATSAM